jgi:hypothetical protein
MSFRACSSSSSSAVDETIASTARITFPPAFSATEGNSIIVRGSASDDTSEVTVVRVNGIDSTSSGNCALIVDNVVAVDLTSVAITIVSDTSSTPNAVNAFIAPVGVVLDSANNRAPVFDVNLFALVAVDLVNGQRVFLSRSLVRQGGRGR